MDTANNVMGKINQHLIILLDKHEVQRLDYDDDSGLRTNQNILVATLPLCEDNPIFRNIVSRQLAKNGTILVQSPYDLEQYEDLSEASCRFAVAKYMYFSLLCNLLGAKEVVVEHIQATSSHSKSTYQVQANTIAVGGGVTAHHEQIESLGSQLRLQDTFNGSQPQVEAAEALLEDYNLKNDATMWSLLEHRRRTSNPMVNRRLTLNLSTESKRVFGIAGNLKLPTVIQEIELHYERVLRNVADFTLTTLVSF